MNTLFIAQSLDGYIADKDGHIDYLDTIPNPDNIDMGYKALIDRIDAIVMGRKTYETVLSFDIPWPYTKPVFVLSTTIKTTTPELKGKVEIVKGSPISIVQELNTKGYKNLYIDGASTIQRFLQEDLIDEMIITTIPVLIGDGIPLFKDIPSQIVFGKASSQTYLDAIVQTHYKRLR